MKRKPLSHSELKNLNFMQGVMRYWDWRMTVVFFGLGYLFVYYSSPPVDSLDDPRVRVIEGVIVKVKSCIPEKRSGYVTIEDNNGIEHGERIKNCSDNERDQFLGKSIRTYRFVRNGKLTSKVLETHFNGKPRHTYEDNYGRHKLDAAFIYLGLAFIPVILVSGYRWRKEKAAVLVKEKGEQEALQPENSAE